MRVKITKPLVCFCLPRDLSHTSILYYYRLMRQKRYLKIGHGYLTKTKTKIQNPIKQTTIKETTGDSTIGVVWIPVVR
jgi:hypothetical protein